MSNIIDYIEWRGDLSFEVSPFNEVDNLIFAKLSYLDFTGFIKGDESKSLKDLARDYIKQKGIEKIGMLLNENFPKLLDAVGKSRRFENVLVSDLVDHRDDDQVIQFAAMTFSLPNHLRYVAFRGTDDSLVGWKEDFMLTVLDQVPAQEESLKYLTRIFDKYKDDYFLVGGHSKGGNLSVYSVVNARPVIQGRVLKVYNNDGPGFKNSIIESQAYQAVASKMVTLVPKSSIIGMLLEHEETYDVVQCSIKQSGLLQHDGFTWEVKGTAFLHLPDVDEESKLVSNTLKKVLSDLSIEQRIQFTDAFFDVLSANNQKSLLDIEKGQLSSFFAMSKAYDSLDKETKKALRDVVGAIFGEGFKQFFSSERMSFLPSLPSK